MSPSLETGSHANDEKENEGSRINAELLNQILKKEASILKTDVERATGKGDNYLSIIYRARVEYKLPQSDDIHVKNVIIKNLPQAEYMLGMVKELDFFRREISVYRDLLPKLYEFGDSLVGDEPFERFSAVYQKTDSEDTLILEDLKPQGFVMASRRDRLDLAHAKLVVLTLARLHALSIAYSEKKPDFLASFEDVMYCESNRERLEQFIPPVLRDVTEEIKKWEGFSKIASKMERLQKHFMDQLLNACKSNGFQNILLHGDCWVNNMLFKYSESGELVDLRFVDFQIVRRGSPALDLQYFLFSSLRNEVLFLHFDDLLHGYYSEFSRMVKVLKFSGDVFTFEELNQEMKRTAPFGLYAATTILAVVLGDPEDVADLEKVTVDNGEVQLFGKVYESPAFRAVFEDLIRYFDERGVLD